MRYVSLFSYLPAWQSVTVCAVLVVLLIAGFSFQRGQSEGSRIFDVFLTILFLLLYPAFVAGIYRYPGFARMQGLCFVMYTLVSLAVFLLMTYSPPRRG